MTARIRFLPTGALVVLLCSLLAWLLATAGESRAQPPGQSEKNAEIKKLLKERLDALTSAVELLTILFREGKESFEALALAQRDALKANLDLYDSPKERIAALQKLLEHVTQMYDMTEARFKAAVSTKVAVHQARAIVLEVRIALLREEQKATPSK